MHRLGSTALFVLAAAASASAQINTASYWDQDAGRTGSVLADIGDVNGDGTHELFVGEPRWDAVFPAFSAGRAFVIDADGFFALYTFDGTQTGAEWGSAACKLGDEDGDGYGDFAVGAHYWNSATTSDVGKIVGYSGRTGSVLWTIEGTGKDEELGTSLAWLGDVDGDGDDEFAATRPNAGEVVVYDAGGHVQYTIVRGPNVEFGASIARTGDLDGDGVADLLVGEPGYDSIVPPCIDCGRVVIYSGKSGTWLGYTMTGSAGDRTGTSVSGAGDFNQDGVSDFLAGAMETSHVASHNGAVLLFSGVTWRPLNLVYGANADDRLGLRVVGLGDVDGDGIGDILASAKDGGAQQLGQVLLYSGVDGHELYAWEGTSSPTSRFAALGEGLTAGDWNGDGFGDFAWGDPDYATDQGGGFLVTTGAANTFIGCPAWAKNYGAGWPGRNGVPTLTALADPTIGLPVDVQVGNSLGATTLALALVGTQQVSIPTSKGGTILASSDLVSFIFTLDAAGTVLSDDIPNDPALYFADFYVQVLEADIYASKKLSFTPGLNLHIGIDLP